MGVVVVACARVEAWCGVLFLLLFRVGWWVGFVLWAGAPVVGAVGCVYFMCGLCYWCV